MKLDRNRTRSEIERFKHSSAYPTNIHKQQTPKESEAKSEEKSPNSIKPQVALTDGNNNDTKKGQQGTKFPKILPIIEELIKKKPIKKEERLLRTGSLRQNAPQSPQRKAKVSDFVKKGFEENLDDTPPSVFSFLNADKKPLEFTNCCTLSIGTIKKQSSLVSSDVKKELEALRNEMKNLNQQSMEEKLGEISKMVMEIVAEFPKGGVIEQQS